jgi:(1->4)-alpha-D-glucan 1-alpha-D-glucosylmutase
MVPRATYRLQFHREFGFDDAAQLAPYLARLGVSHLYASPYLKARPGSMHGYDIVDHSQLNPELGDEAAFARLSTALWKHSMGQILDFVPNHMGVGGADNPLWLDVLEWGPDAKHAGWFDIEWDPERRYLHQRVLVPLLGDQYGLELERGRLQLKFDDTEGTFAVWAYDTHKLPICPLQYARILGDAHPELERIGDAFTCLPTLGPELIRPATALKHELAQITRGDGAVSTALTAAVDGFAGRAGDAGSWSALDALIRDQYWRVTHFRVAADDINYRRFFNINELAGLRMELPQVFDRTHELVLKLLRDGTLDGLRIDHIDGLYDPRGYLHRLCHRLGGRRSARPYLVVEKILAAHEWLPADWPIAGTTGYEFANLALGLMMDGSQEQRFTDIYADFAGPHQPFAEVVRECKRQIMENEMTSELNLLAREIVWLARSNPRTMDFTHNLMRRAVAEIIACFPVYRTYIDADTPPDAAAQRDIVWALAEARRHERELDPSVFDFLQSLLLGELTHPRSGFSRQRTLRCVMKFQQYSGPVMAKGLEDTAFYRHYRFVALNEVGGSPDRFGVTIAAFHRGIAQRAQRWPHALLSTSTHDSKRGEDARARLAALSELPEEWAQQLALWSRILRGPPQPTEIPAPDRNDEYFFYQLLLGSWPVELLTLPQPEQAHEGMAAYCERVRGSMIKAVREARVHSQWAFPDKPYEEAVLAFVDGALVGSRAAAFIPAFVPFAQRIAALGAHNTFVQTVLKLTCPGVPDLYQGSERWDLNLVDPDNRRPVDFAAGAALLASVESALTVDRTGAVVRLFEAWQDGAFKLAVIMLLLRCRREHEALFADGDYQPLAVEGECGEEVCVYARTLNGRALLVMLARHPRRWRETCMPELTCTLPPSLRRQHWRELLTGREASLGEGPAIAPLLAALPAAVFLADGDGSSART